MHPPVLACIFYRAYAERLRIWWGYAKSFINTIFIDYTPINYILHGEVICKFSIGYNQKQKENYGNVAITRVRHSQRAGTYKILASEADGWHELPEPQQARYEQDNCYSLWYTWKT